MGKKASPTPPPVVEVKKEEPEEVIQPLGEILEGDFLYQDGSTYSGQYLKNGSDVSLHGNGILKAGPESFQGRFEKGGYREGTYTSPSGATYKGDFLDNLFHGIGEYQWPDGRIYKGSWKDGQMHGRGQFVHFYAGVGRAFSGFSLMGSFASDPQGQKDAKQAFLAAYGEEYLSSAKAALGELVEAAAANPDAGPKKFLVLPAADDERQSVTLDRNAAEEVCDGPFPEAGNLPAAAALQAFADRAQDSAAPLEMILYEMPAGISAADWKQPGQQPAAGSFDGKRLRRPQLQHCGQAVGCRVQDVADDGAVQALVLVNISPERSASQAKWKLVFCQVAS